MAKGLTPKENRFCEEYLVDLNQTQAAIRAGYSKRSARNLANRLMMKDDIQARISDLRQQQQERTGITADRVIEELAHLAFARMSNVVKVNNSVTEIKDFDDLGENELAAIASVKTRQIISEDRETFDAEIKMHSKDNALKLLMQHMGLLSDLNIAEATAAKYGYTLARIDTDEDE